MNLHTVATLTCIVIYSVIIIAALGVFETHGQADPTSGACVSSPLPHSPQHYYPFCSQVLHGLSKLWVARQLCVLDQLQIVFYQCVSLYFLKFGVHLKSKTPIILYLNTIVDNNIM